MKAILNISLGICLLLCASFAHAQTTFSRQVIGSTGGYTNTGNIAIAHTTGEAVVSTETGTTITLTQGFHQGPTVAAYEVEVFNAFSPDGDGVNEEWFIPAVESHPENTVTIFNRWGDRINRFENYNNADVVWTGTNESGDELASGTYFYSIEFADGTDAVTGWVYLFR